MSNKQSVATGIGQLLATLGMRKCFGVLGSANFKVADALVRAGVPYVAARHETNAVTMGDAYARISDEFVVVTVHSGPGLTNALTGIAEAAKSRTPLLILAGDVATGDVRSNFYFEQADAVRSVGATFEKVHGVSTALQDTARAAIAVMRDRHTVVLSVPVDILDAPLPHRAKDRPLSLRSTTGAPDPASLVAVADAVIDAQRPLILAGRGAVVAKAKQDLVELGDEIGALMATSAAGHGLFADEVWSLGISGGFASPAALELIPQSDLILGFGVSFTHWTTRKRQLIGKETKLIQIDSDASQLEINQPVDYAIIGDARLTAQLLLSELRRRRKDRTSAGWRTEPIGRKIAAGGTHDIVYEDTSTADHIDPRTLSKTLDRMLPMERVVVIDSGHFMGWPPLYFRVPDERGWCLTASFQSTGLGIATAIGAGLAQPNRLVILGTGDGGLLMSIADFETVVRLSLRMCIVIYNDLAYGAEVHYFGLRNYPTDLAKFPDVNFCAIAKGFGARAVEVRSTHDLAPVQSWVDEGSPGVLVIDARVNPHVVADWFNDAFKVEPTDLTSRIV